MAKDKVHNHAEALVQSLSANRRLRKTTEKPLIFVAHSLGGLVVKRALIYSESIEGPKIEHLRSVFVSTYGIIFLGTPHHGSDLASWGTYLEKLCEIVMPKKFMDTEPQLLAALKSNNETLQNIDRQFMQIINKFHIFFFHEARPSNLKGTLRFIVEEDSAAPTLPDVERAGIQADHSHMCKFDNENSPGFQLVAEAIYRYAEDAEHVIPGRWDAENQTRRFARYKAAEELVPKVDSLSIGGPTRGSISPGITSSAGTSAIGTPSKTPYLLYSSSSEGTPVVEMVDDLDEDVGEQSPIAEL